MHKELQLRSQPAAPRPLARRLREGRTTRGPQCLAGSRHSRGGGQGGLQVPRPHQAQPHPHQPPQAVPAQGRLPGRPGVRR